MSYNVNVNGRNTEVNSFKAAVAVVGNAAQTVADRLRNTSAEALNRLYRSPKAAQRVFTDRQRQASNVARVKLPARAGSYDGRANGFAWSIEQN